MSGFTLTIRPGHPDFLDLPWNTSLTDWSSERLIDLPKGISRHEVRFVVYDQAIYAIKELPSRAARQDFEVLRALEKSAGLAVTPVGLVEMRHADRTAERSAALITLYVEFSFSYRELLEGHGFGRRRNQMLAAFATLLVQLHLAGCHWRDCSLSNVLYRYDAAGIQTLMVDAETAELHKQLSDGQRQEDLEIMKINVAGGMADIAASLGTDINHADLSLGDAIETRYETLWDQLTKDIVIPTTQRWRITERVQELNELGFTVEEIDLEVVTGGDRLRLETVVGKRTFHADRLRQLTGVEASEGQATQILTDLYRYQARSEASRSNKTLAAIRWRLDVLDPLLDRLRQINPSGDPIQGFCDFLRFRYFASRDSGRDVPNSDAFEQWLHAQQPGYPLATNDVED